MRAVQLLLGHSKIESTVRYLDIEIDDAIEIAEKIDIYYSSVRTKLATLSASPIAGRPRSDIEIRGP